MDTGYDLQHLLREARRRWLMPGEVLFILQNHDPGMIAQHVHQMPAGGSLLLFNRNNVPSFRGDGHKWRKKPHRNSVNEAHEKLKVRNVEALACYYAKREDNPNFRRRSYWMLDKANNHIVLVHYLDITKHTTNSASILEFSTGQSYTLTESVNNMSLENQGTASLSDMHGSHQSLSLCSPRSVEVNSRVVAGKQWMDHFNNSTAAGNVSTSLEVEMFPCQLLQVLEEQLGLNYDIGKESVSYDNEKQNIDGTTVLGCDKGVKELDQGATFQQREYSGRYDGMASGSTDHSTWKEIASMSVLEEAGNSEACLERTPCGTNILDSYSMLPNPGQDQMPLGANPSLTVIPEQKFKIREILPEWCFANETTKVIVIGSFCCDPSETVCAMFGNIEVPVQIMQDGVICCQAPSNCHGKVTFCITSGNRESCSEAKYFEYRDRNSACNNCIKLQQEEKRRMEEVKLLVEFVEMLSSDSSLEKGESNNFHIDPSKIQKEYEYSRVHNTKTHLTGYETSFGIIDRVLQELLKDKLQKWLATRFLDGDNNLSCILSKKERGIIHLVAGLGYEWALKPILDSGVGVNFRDTDGWTALHWAARFGRETMVCALITCGASVVAVTDPTAQDPLGKNPASIADANGHKGLAGYLSELALTSQFSALTFEEVGSEHLEAEVDASDIPTEFVASVEDQSSMKEVLEATRKASKAAALIQHAFRVHSFRRRQQREAGNHGEVDEYGLTSDEIQGISAAVFSHSHRKSVAALTIQKCYRGWKRRSHFLTVRKKVVKIQAHVRGYRFRKYYRVIRVVGIMEKIVLRWRRKRVGLRGFKIQGEPIDEDEDVLGEFRRKKVDTTVREAVKRVRCMIHSREARGQYSRMLQAFRQAKAKLGVSTKEDALDSLAEAFAMDNDNADAFQLPLQDTADSPDYCELWSQVP